MHVLKSLLLLPFMLLLMVNSSMGQDNKIPKLVVTIIIDPLSPDWIEDYQDQLSTGGILKLINEGKSFTSATVGNALASRASSVATIATAAPPSIHGIVGNSWYDRLKKEEIFSTEDYLVQGFDNFSQLSKNSSTHLLSTSLGDQVVRTTEGKLISLSLEPDAAILAGGHRSHGSYWFDTYSGSWISNRSYVDKLPQWVIDFNNHNHADQYLNQEWDLLLNEDAYAKCNIDESPYEMGILGSSTRFPYRLRRMTRQVTQGKYEAIKKTPFGNTLLSDFSIAALHNEQMGLDEHTDFLYISFTGFSHITSRFGVESREFKDAVIRLDMEIQHLLFVLSENIGKDNVLVMLTGTHGASWNADQAKANGLPAGRFRARNAMALLNSFISAIYGENYWIESYIDQQIYLDQTLIDQEKIPIAIIQEQAARFMRQFEGVAMALPADRMVSASITHPAGSLFQAAYNSNRSGDILLILQPGWIQDGNLVSDHLSVYPYDQKVPFIWWGGSVMPGSISDPVSLKDIAPTICEYANVPVPNTSQGKSLYKLIVAATDNGDL
ncbi:MAG: alkaline phosphatase family protein [Bacteroidetes bacterium]|jgi:predicted AlkP superfamily pyrophosphatase or phosphodiesterase|nr:alkaline phosphatase family protein [Bacteroidota bacterium]MBT3747913.1 alkaline phosphatase family protein [Bacteroidota bacterium]MBT4398171.1 alkaline phosphatase family protein [Bacteroidota bacterium]MBT4410028.1 alkaline phosphatase family protein [Bacteroidota bacterium]MBT5425774.1 alkaline phosphatase family protein [Bacteroidota bacterium]